jgi:1-acyl-sn-glycerol-3-phosphate acyltransferase
VKVLLQQPGRVTTRLLWLAGEVAFTAASFPFRCWFRPSAGALARLAAWLQNHSRRVLRIFNTRLELRGPIPSQGLLVCNHLSYLDILVLAASTPAVFVSKREVRSWPVFGWFARMAGTVFVHRERRSHVAHVTDQIDAALRSGALVVLFPEGTSSNGQTILPFKSALLEPAMRTAHPLWAGLIQYELDDGDVGEEVCYWKDMTLAPHLLNLLGKEMVRASVQFARFSGHPANRKDLARQLHATALGLLQNRPALVDNKVRETSPELLLHAES